MIVKPTETIKCKENTLYIVTMYRYGDHERHSYVLGTFDDLELANTEANKEQEHRGGNKYYPEIIKVQLNVSKKQEVMNASNNSWGT